VIIICYVSSAAPQAKGVCESSGGHACALTTCRHMYRSRNLGNGKIEIQNDIKLSQSLTAEFGVRIDTENQQFVGKVENW